ERLDRAAGLRRAGTSARLALRDGERDRLRRRGQLVPVRPPRGLRFDGGSRPGVTCPGSDPGRAPGGHVPQKVARRAGAMRVLGLPRVAELSDRLFLPGRDEDRVVAKPLAPSGLLRDPALEDPGAAHLLARRRDRDELAEVPRAAPLAVAAAQLREQPPDRIVAAEPCRADARPAAEAVDLDA